VPTRQLHILDAEESGSASRQPLTTRKILMAALGHKHVGGDEHIGARKDNRHTAQKRDEIDAHRASTRRAGSRTSLVHAQTASSGFFAVRVAWTTCGSCQIMSPAPCI